MKIALVAVLAASLLTATPGAASASTACSVATASRVQDTWLPGAVAAPGAVSYSRFTLTSSAWAIVKVGDLRSDLDLSLYDASCQLVAASHHAGTAFEQVYRPLSAGRYYVGVSGAAGATGSFRLRFGPLRDGIHALSAHTYVTPFRSDEIEIDGEVLNNRSTPTFYRYVNITLLSATGQVVARTTGNFAGQYVRARSRSSFIATLIKPSKPFARVTVATVTQALQGYPPPQRVTLVASPVTHDAQGNVHYPGQITNRSTKPIFLGRVTATLYDTFGNVDYVNDGPVTPGTLQPAKTGRFDVIFPSPTGVNAALLVYP